MNSVRSSGPFGAKDKWILHLKKKNHFTDILFLFVPLLIIAVVSYCNDVALLGYPSST